MIFVRQLQLQVVFNGVGGLEGLAFFELLAQGPAGHFEDGQQFSLFGGPQAFDQFERLRRGLQQARNAVCAQQFFSQLKHVFADHAGAQQDGQQLDIAEGLGASGEQLFAWPRLGGQVFDAHWMPLPGAAVGPFLPLLWDWLAGLFTIVPSLCPFDRVCGTPVNPYVHC